MKVSILIPTYKRLDFLKRAVADAFAQSYVEWELIVSDDEVGEGETWQWLRELEATDPRVRAVKNDGPRHGQVFNVNNGLRQCRGEWIKVLFDDDRMLPDCVEKMMAVAERLPGLAMVGCRAQQWRNGVHVSDERDFSASPVEVIAKGDCRLAICKFDRWNGRTPTHMLVKREAIQKGALMPEHDKYKVPVDVVWFADVLDHGDYAMMADVLVHQREGEVQSITSVARSAEDSLDNELLLAYHDIYGKLDVRCKERLLWGDVAAEICGIRGIYHIRCRRFGLGMKMVMKMFRSPRGMALTLRWLLQVMFYPRFSATERISVNPEQASCDF